MRKKWRKEAHTTNPRIFFLLVVAVLSFTSIWRDKIGFVIFRHTAKRSVIFARLLSCCNSYMSRTRKHIREKKKKSNQICKIKSSADDDDDDLRGANTKKKYKYKCILLFVWRCLAIMFFRQIVDVYGPPPSMSSAHIFNLCTHATTDTTADNDAPRPNPFQVESIHCWAPKLDMNFLFVVLPVKREPFGGGGGRRQRSG